MKKANVSFDNEPKDVRKTLNVFYNGMIGKELKFNTPFGEKPAVYADFTASGRAFAPLEDVINHDVLPYYSNIHSTGVYLPDQVQKYRVLSKDIIRKYVNADPEKDRVILTGQGTTSAINKLVSILRLKEYTQFYMDLVKLKKIHEIFLAKEEPSTFEKIGDILYIKEDFLKLFQKERKPFNSLKDVTSVYDSDNANFIYDLMKDAEYFKPIVFYSYMEHNSNFLPWRQDGVELVQIRNQSDLEKNLKNYQNHYIKIGSFSAASNITGRLSDVDKLAVLMHSNGGLAFFDYAAGAPYLHMDMNSMLPLEYRKELGFHDVINEEDKKYCYKDALFFSPHKFLGGNNTPGVLICKESITNNLESAPSQPGGGTVLYVTKERVHYSQDIETREEGGTPDIIGSIRIGFALSTRERISHMDLAVMDGIINNYVTEQLKDIKNLKIIKDFDDDTPHLPIYSFLISYKNKYFHYNYISCLLNDLFGIQTRPGCACAPLYGLILLFGDEETETRTNLLNKLEYYTTHNQAIFKPGFTRLNFPYFYPKFIIDYILHGIRFVALHAHEFLPFYKFSVETGSYHNCFNIKLKQAFSSSLSKLFNYNGNNLSHLNSLQSEMKKTISYTNKLLIKLDMYIKNDKTINENIKDQGSLFTKDSDNFMWFVIYDDIKDESIGREKDLTKLKGSKSEIHEEKVLVSS